jgi:hypothetical protein
MQINISRVRFNFINDDTEFVGLHKFDFAPRFKTKAAIEVAAVCYFDIYFFKFQCTGFLKSIML